jgi:AP endonuclease-1
MVLHRQEVKVEENGTATKVKTTQKRTTKKKAEKVAPLEERTQGSKLRVGAHVSIAGGKSPSAPPHIKR